MVGFCEYDSEHLGFVNGRAFRKLVISYCVCTNYLASWSYVRT